MKTGLHIATFPLLVLMGCAGVPGAEGGLTAAPSVVGVPPDNRLAQKRVPPRIARWLARSKVDFRMLDDVKGGFCLTLDSADGMTADRREYVAEYFRSRVAEFFAKANALEPRQVAVAILSEQMDDHAYRGKASAFGVDDIEMSYDSVTHLGRLAMKVRGGDFDGTRALIRSRIEAIVRDKNICLVAGVTPPPGRYYLLGETVKPGNVLEIEFKSE
ncbi:MAG: hypothetical protein Q4G65_13245 [bacterium]|nr:hypothetical protein [bacterium]